MLSTIKYYLILIVILVSSFAEKLNAQVSVIANNTIIVNAIDNNTLKNLFTLRSNELGSQKVKLFFINSENETVKKLLHSIGKSFHEIKKEWLRAKLTGNGNPPEMVPSDKEMLEKIFTTPNAIGFIDSKLVPSHMKVLLKID
ncbi:MAG: hypothetical protein CVV23_08140 [Ignavibacteriae bacterium HGW-Ignavibacteriae-2]|jgi:uncharacterized protein YhhL (DUF1145 family)|nr:MAG: hypothetical protein CVV23_08140 [Ignavibacteriae bacterium HGW-Ignavibacteriae-2]